MPSIPVCIVHRPWSVWHQGLAISSWPTTKYQLMRWKTSGIHPREKCHPRAVDEASSMEALWYTRLFGCILKSVDDRWPARSPRQPLPTILRHLESSLPCSICSPFPLSYSLKSPHCIDCWAGWSELHRPLQSTEMPLFIPRVCVCSHRLELFWS